MQVVMTKGLFAGAALALLMVAIPAHADIRFAYVDVQRALNECDAGKKAKNEFRGRVQTIENKLQRQQNEVQTLKDELEKKGMLMKADQRQNLPVEPAPRGLGQGPAPQVPGQPAQPVPPLGARQ